MAKSTTKSSKTTEGPRLIRPIVGAYRGQIIFAGDDYDQAIAEGWAVDADAPHPEPPGEAIEDLDGKVELAKAMTDKWAAAGGPTGGPNSPIEPAVAPVLTSIDPDTAEVGAADVTMTCTGENFDESCVIMWNDAAEVTEFLSATTLSTVVKPSTASSAGASTVQVAKGDLTSAVLEFTFTDPVSRSRTKRT